MGAFSDRARALRAASADTRVEGRYPKTRSPGPWFRCFFDPGDDGETRSPGSVRRRRAGATVVTLRRALDGTAIDVRAGDQLEIDLRAGGTMVVDVQGAPQVIMRGKVGVVANVGVTDGGSPG